MPTGCRSVSQYYGPRRTHTKSTGHDSSQDGEVHEFGNGQLAKSGVLIPTINSIQKSRSQQRRGEYSGKWSRLSDFRQERSDENESTDIPNSGSTDLPLGVRNM